MRNLLNTLRYRLTSFFYRQREWKEIEYFDPFWEQRVNQMAFFIKENESVLDLGCGKMFLKNLIDEKNYYPVDYTKRDKDTIVCDFNKYEFPTIKTDIGFVSGTLEYIKDVNWFIEQLHSHCKRIILSYCTTDDFALRQRIKNYWVNHYSEASLLDLFSRNKFRLTAKSKTSERNIIFVFEHE